jgi:hypothetical protein
MCKKVIVKYIIINLKNKILEALVIKVRSNIRNIFAILRNLNIAWIVLIL